MTEAPAIVVVTPERARTGMRLQRCEVLNWGTFHGSVWGLDVNGENALLTGDIGSGKSTLVDAVTTLLVPAQKIAYNKAAGAEARERDLRSYVLGHFKSERGELGYSAKPVGLRDYKTYAVILGRFRNEAFDQDVTLAQVFWFREPHGQPARFYVVADRPLSIAEHFQDFGGDVAALKKRLRSTPSVEVHDSFPPYGAAFRRRFGIQSDQALDLFRMAASPLPPLGLLHIARIPVAMAMGRRSAIAIMSFDRQSPSDSASTRPVCPSEKVKAPVRKW